MSEALGPILVLLIVLVAVAVPILPLTLIAIVRHRKRGGSYVGQGLCFALLNGLIAGILLGGAGFLFGAGIPDESAGEAAILLVGIGLAVGGVGGFVLSFATICIVCWRTSAKRSPEEDEER